MATRPVGPQRVGVTRGRPTEELKQQQARNVHAIPTQRQVGSESLTYSLDRQHVSVTFDVADDGRTYVAGMTKTVRVNLAAVPTGFHYHIASVGALSTVIVDGTAIQVWAVNKSAWTTSSIQVMCNQGGVRAGDPANDTPAPGVVAALEVF